MPTVSIITPLYNKAAYIANTIVSVLNQTYSDWEMLIVDNGSTDGSLEKAKQITDSRIHLLQSQKQGPGAARNYGLTQAQGEWIQFLDADDLLTPNHLEEQLAVARINPHAEIIVGYWQEFNDKNPTERIIKQPSGIGQPIELLRDSVIAFAPWAVHAALIKRSVLSEDYFWPEELDFFLSEDTAFWFRLVTNCSVIFTSNCTVIYRKQTPLCRNDYCNPYKWLESMKAITSYNVNFLKTRGNNPSAKQCEMLMRCFLSAASFAHSQRDFTTEREAFACADQWLCECAKLGGINTIPLYIRQKMGLRLIQHIIWLRSRLENIFDSHLNSLKAYD